MKNITFINAGAGSGKTYRLTTDLARILTQESVEPSQVILTTFTKLAASEFREKARREILNAKDVAGHPIDASVRIKCATQLDNAFIGTTHAISNRFIVKYWYLLDYGANIQSMSEQNQDFYMSQSIYKIASDTELQAFRDFRNQFNVKDGYGHSNHLFWLPELKNIVDKMAYYDIKTTKKSIDESKAVAKKVFNGREFKELFGDIDKYLDALKSRCNAIKDKPKSKSKAERFLSAIEKVGKITRISDLEDDGIKECLVDTIGNKNDDFYSSEVYEAAQKAKKELKVSCSYLSVVESYIDAIFSLAEKWQEKICEYKQDNHIISYDDMEKIFLSMLTEEKYKEVQDDIKLNFKLLMVDEFQDSNPVQLKIFNRISELIAENGGRTIWVGDPKQTIYGFRGSDSRFVNEILKKFRFSEDGTAVLDQGEEKLSTDQLLESWRSRPALVEFVNKVFLEPFKASGLKEKQITLEPHFKRENDTMGNAESMYTWYTEGGKEHYVKLAHAIKKLVESKQKVHHGSCDKETSEIEYRDIAVLSASNDQCKNVASALKKIGVPVSCEETNLEQTIEVYLLKTLLLFFQNPSDKMLRAELVIMLKDATTEEILKDRIEYVLEKKEENADKWMDADSEHKYAETIGGLLKIAQRYKNLSVYDTVVAICEELDLNNIVEKWGDATQRKQNLAAVIEMAKNYDSMCLNMGIGSSVYGFVSYLSITKPPIISDNTSNAVKVLTYHTSKGLEWPVVILNELSKSFLSESSIGKTVFGVKECACDEKDDIFSREYYINLLPKSIAPNGAKVELSELMLENVKKLRFFDQEMEQNKREKLRLLYVGVTRAKDILITFTKGKCSWIEEVGISSKDGKAPWGDDSGELVILTEEAQDDAKKMQYTQSQNRPAVNDAPQLWLAPSTIKDFSNIFIKNEKVQVAGERFIDMSIFSEEKNDDVRGSCIHNIFACYKENDIERNMCMAEQILSNFGFVKSTKEQKMQLINSVEWLYSCLKQKYGEATRIEREYAFCYQLETEQVLRGDMDLLWFYKNETGQEKCVLVDYKSFPGKRDELENKTQEYYAQMSAYYAALTGAGVKVEDVLIFYPVQGEIRRLLK